MLPRLGKLLDDFEVVFLYFNFYLIAGSSSKYVDYFFGMKYGLFCLIFFQLMFFKNGCVLSYAISSNPNLL